jgi:hypothetical protein
MSVVFEGDQEIRDMMKDTMGGIKILVAPIIALLGTYGSGADLPTLGDLVEVTKVAFGTLLEYAINHLKGLPLGELLVRLLKLGAGIFDVLGKLKAAANIGSIVWRVQSLLNLASPVESMAIVVGEPFGNCSSDTASPTLSVNCGTLTGGAISFSWSATDACTSTPEIQYQYRLDPVDSGWSPWNSDTSKSYFELTPGNSYTFHVKAKDKKGNESAVKDCPFKVPPIDPCASDSVRPTLDVSCPAASTSMTFSWSGTDNCTQPAEIQYSYNLAGYSTSWSPWSSDTSKSYFELTPGNSYTFHVKAKDKKGNESAVKDCSFKVPPIDPCVSDSVKPTLDVSCPAPSTESMSFSWSATDYCTPNSEIQYQYKLEPAESGWSGWGWGTSKSYSNLACGPYTFYVQAKDKKGNTSQKTCPFEVPCKCDNDTTPPTLSVTCGTPSTSGAISFSWSATDECSTGADIQYRCRLDPLESSWSSWGSVTSKNYSNLACRQYTFYVQTKDKKGNSAQENCAFLIGEWCVSCAPELLSPADGAQFISKTGIINEPWPTIHFVWTAISCAIEYRIELQCLWYYPNEHWESWPAGSTPGVGLTTGGSTSFDWVPEWVGTWRWRVWAVGPGGDVGRKTDWRFFEAVLMFVD